MAPRATLRERGELVFLEPSDTQTFTVEVGVLDGVEEIERFTRTVAEAAP